MPRFASCLAMTFLVVTQSDNKSRSLGAARLFYPSEFSNRIIFPNQLQVIFVFLQFDC